MPAHPIARWAVPLGPLLPILAALVVWTPILGNYFQHDDFFHLYDIATLGFAKFVADVQVGQLYVVRNAVFYATFRAFGPDPRPYFWFQLLTHVLNVFLLYRVVRRLAGDSVLACIGAVLWGTAPALEGALGWYSAYGQVLLTTIVLALLASFARFLEEERPLSARRAVCWGALLMAGGASYGAGMGFAAAFPLAVLVAVPGSRRTRASVWLLALAPVLTFALYAILRAISPPSPVVFAEALSAHATIAALPGAAVLVVHLLAFGVMTLLLGFLGVGRGYPDPTAVTTAGGVLLVVALAWLRSDAWTRRRLLAIALLLLGTYGSIALGRASFVRFYGGPIYLPATWIRYHYLPTAILTVLLCSALAVLRAGSTLVARVVYGIGGLWLAARLLSVVVRPVSIAHHDYERAATEGVLRSIEAAVAATPAGETVRIENRPFPPTFVVLTMAPGTFPGWAGVFAIFYRENAVDGRPVRFAVSDDEWERAQLRGGRMAQLVVRGASP